APLRKVPLWEKAQVEFAALCTMPIVPLGQLIGGKICAALDRQHARDLDDIKDLLAHEGFSEHIKTGFLFYLLSSDRPINELLHPNLHDQRSTLRNHFDGMSMEPFSYEDYETARQALVSTIQSGLTAEDKDFLLAFKNTTP